MFSLSGGLGLHQGIFRIGQLSPGFLELRLQRRLVARAPNRQGLVRKAGFDVVTFARRRFRSSTATVLA